MMSEALSVFGSYMDSYIEASLHEKAVIMKIMSGTYVALMGDNDDVGTSPSD
mgnify:CR=1 FL=1